MHRSLYLKLFFIGAFFAALSSTLFGYEFTGASWPQGSDVRMELELNAINLSLTDGFATWNDSAAGALAIWNTHLELMQFSYVLDSLVVPALGDGLNSVFFNQTVFGDQFGPDTLAVTIWQTDEHNGAVETEADVVFTVFTQYDSYRGPLRDDAFDFHRVALHEFGHVLGLAHVNNTPPGQAIMEPIISDLDHLAADDIAGAVALYGNGITSPLTLEFNQGYPVSSFIQASNNPFSFSATGLPPGLLLRTTGEISGTATVQGTYEVTVTAYGSPRDVTAVITITIAPAQITSAKNVTGVIGTSLSYTIQAGNSPTSFTAIGLPPGMVLNTKTGVISGIPTLHGTFKTAVVAHGTAYNASSTVTFTINGPTLQPTSQLQIEDGDIRRAVQDPVRDRLYLLTNNFLVAVDTELAQIIKSIPLASAEDIALSVDGTKIWAADAKNIHAFSLSDFNELPVIPNGPFLCNQLREGIGKKLYLTPTEGGILILNTVTGAKTTLITAAQDSVPAIETTVDGHDLYASYLEENVGEAVLHRFDISGSSPVLKGSRATNISGLAGFSVSPDKQVLTYTTQAVYSVSTNDLAGAAVEIEPGTTYGDVSFVGSGSTAYFSVSDGTKRKLDYINASTGQVYSTSYVTEGGFAFVSHSGRYLYINGINSLDIYPLRTTPDVTPAANSLLNVSTRSTVGTDDDRMIGGFIITGDEPKQIGIRALGPSLPVAGALANPQVTVYDSDNKVVASNLNWNSARSSLIEAGLNPADEHEAALITTLAPGSYTAVVSAEAGATGVGLVEIYDLSSDNSSKLANISTRGKVGAADDVLIGGFILGGKTATKVIVRAIGPSLAASGVTGVLPDPTLELYNGNGAEIASNDDWASDQKAEISATGIPPTNSKEPAIVATLAAGPYTAIVRGRDGGAGVALVEVYNLTPTP